MSRSLKTRVLASTASIAASQLLTLLLRLASTLIMTRLLVPEAFGIVALASSVQTIVAMLSDIGISQAVIQSRNGASPVMLNTAWVLQIARGALIFLVCLVLALVLYWLQHTGLIDPKSTYGVAELPYVIAVSALSSVILGFRSTKVILAERSVNYLRVTVIELASQAIGLVFMTVFGLLTRSVWALVAGGLVAAAASVVMSHAMLDGPSNKFAFDGTSARSIIKFGKWIFLASGVFVLASQGDRLMIGAWADASVLGAYWIAYSLATLVEGLSNRIFASVGMAALSERAREAPERLRETFYRFRLPFDAAVLFISGAGFACGHIVVDILYDDRYAQAGYMVEVLLLMPVVTRLALSGHTYMALGQPRLLVPINVTKVVSLYALVPLAHAHFGLTGAIWAIALHEMPLIPLVLYLNYRLKILDLHFESLILLCWPAGYMIGLGILSAWNALIS